MAEALVIAAVFLLAGAVKGVVGLGLPTVSLGLLTAFLGLDAAMALMLVPSFVTNLWQGLAGGHAAAVLRRTWPFLLVATATVWLGVRLAAGWPQGVLTAILGGLLVAYGAAGLWRPPVALPAGWRHPVGVLAGAVNGVLTGLTGSFVVPGVFYLQAAGLPRDLLVQAMGLLFTASTVALAVCLGAAGMLDRGLGLASVLATLPALAGMVAGARLRRRLSEARFRTAFFVAIALLGVSVTAMTW